MAILALTKNLSAFLDLIAASEGTSSSPLTSCDGYDVIVTGIQGPNRFSDYSGHPFAHGRRPIIVRNTPTLIGSTASGRYQITLPTWRNLIVTLKSSLFTPQNQDAAAVLLLKECSALNLIYSAQIPKAITAACETWASFPGNSYGQGVRTMEWLMVKYMGFLAA